jgi:hypothetical protein
MKHIAIASIIFLLTQHIQAQTEVIRIKAGEDISNALSAYGKYRFASFTKGRLYYEYGKTATAKFNYNYLLEEMQFIDPATGDTLSVANPDQVRLIQFDSTVFYYNEGFMEILKDYDTVRVAMKQKLKISFEKIGAFGQPNTSSAIDNHLTYYDRSSFSKLTIKQDAVVKKEITWYLVTGGRERPVKADKAGFQKLYPNHASDIKQFLKINKDGLRDLEAVKQLLVICLQ